MKTIEMTPVTSSQIRAIGHDAESQTLRVEFVRGGASYDYQNVTAEMHQNLMKAESVGSFFSQNIKANPTLFPYAKVETVA